LSNLGNYINIESKILDTSTDIIGFLLSSKKSSHYKNKHTSAYTLVPFQTIKF